MIRALKSEKWTVLKTAVTTPSFFFCLSGKTAAALVRTGTTTFQSSSLHSRLYAYLRWGHRVTDGEIIPGEHIERHLKTLSR
ncbi:hypothetical protein NC651_018278 [Populus alba x Populus x berolinensis]|nr:hypothetical protein NC651_018278 [Populus alba x Populus x berolinensis]